MRITLVYPSVGRKEHKSYVRAWQMEPLSMAWLAGRGRDASYPAGPGSDPGSAPGPGGLAGRDETGTGMTGAASGTAGNAGCPCAWVSAPTGGVHIASVARTGHCEPPSLA